MLFVGLEVAGVQLAREVRAAVVSEKVDAAFRVFDQARWREVIAKAYPYVMCRPRNAVIVTNRFWTSRAVFVQILHNTVVSQHHPLRRYAHIDAAPPRNKITPAEWWIDKHWLSISKHGKSISNWALYIDSNDCSGLGATRMNETRPRRARAVVGTTQL